jgi:hypothetical protein
MEKTNKPEMYYWKGRFSAEYGCEMLLFSADFSTILHHNISVDEFEQEFTTRNRAKITRISSIIRRLETLILDAAHSPDKSLPLLKKPDSNDEFSIELRVELSELVQWRWTIGLRVVDDPIGIINQHIIQPSFDIQHALSRSMLKLFSMLKQKDAEIQDLRRHFPRDYRGSGVYYELFSVFKLQ